jgi:hypothetical protein
VNSTAYLSSKQRILEKHGKTEYPTPIKKLACHHSIAYIVGEKNRQTNGGKPIKFSIAWVPFNDPKKQFRS